MRNTQTQSALYVHIKIETQHLLVELEYSKFLCVSETEFLLKL